MSTINLSTTLDPLCGVRWLGLVDQAKSPKQRKQIVADLLAQLIEALPVGTFVQPSLEAFKCGWVRGHSVGGTDIVPVPFVTIELHNGDEILAVPDLLERAVYDQSAQHHFPVFVNDRTHITREALALEYLQQSPLHGEIMERVTGDIQVWMTTLYTTKCFAALPQSVYELHAKIISNPNREMAPFQLAKEACDWLFQAEQEYKIAFERKPRSAS